MKKTPGFRLKILLLLFTTTFFSCINEDTILEPNIKNNVPFETVSITEAKNLFKENGTLKALAYDSKNEPYIIPNLNEITQEIISNTDELITVIPVNTPNKHLYSRVLLLKINNKIESVVFSMLPSKKRGNQKFTGKIFITELDGSFLYGYRVVEGKIFSKLIQNKDTQSASKNSTLIVGLALEDNCEFQPGGCTLNEVVITGSSGGSSENNNIDISYVYNYSGGYETTGGTGGSSGFSYGDTNSWDYNNGSIEECSGSKYYDNITQNCECLDSNKVQDSNGICVNPDEIKNNLTNKCARDIFNELENEMLKKNLLNSLEYTPAGTQLNFVESILKLFNDSRTTNLSIRNDKIGNTNASTIGTSITLNDSYLNSATQLSITRTIIHESVHAYLNAMYSNVLEFNSFTFKQKMEKFASDNGYEIGSGRFQHEFMGQYVEAMAYSLYEWDKNYGTGGSLGWNYYYAMGFGGLFYKVKDVNGNPVQVETDSFIALVPSEIERNNIIKTLYDEQEGNSNSKGTKCN